LNNVIETAFSKEEFDRIAKKTGFVTRNRKLSASCFVNSLMFSIYNQSQTSLPDITEDLNQQFGIDISKEALHKRFTPQAVKFLKEVIKMQLSRQINVVADNDLKSLFPSIKIKDSSKFSLPSIYNGCYPGFGNFSKVNGLMNIQYEYDLVSGNWISIELTKGTRNDQQDSKETLDLISKGDLHIRDLGYITPTYLKDIIDKKAYFLNRLPSQINVYSLEKELINWSEVHHKLKKSKDNTLDIDVLIYEKDLLKCRLLIEPVSDQEYRKRLERAKQLAKSQGTSVSEKHKIKCRYNTFITNIDRSILPIEKIRKSYYIRWQIELIFKTWKSFFEINKVKRVKKERLECQLLAKLLWILLNWKLFQASNYHIRRIKADQGISILKFFKKCLKFSQTLRLVVLKKLPLKTWLKTTFLPLIKNTICEAAGKKLTHYQVLAMNLSSLS
jgi:Transposase DDE domain